LRRPGRYIQPVLIQDPFFYAVAIPAVLLLGLSKSGFGSGFGSLAVPIMAIAVPVPQAAAILLPCLLVMDILGQGLLWRHIDRALMKWLIPCGLVGTVVGTLMFRFVDSRTVAGIVGVSTLLFLAQRMLFPPKPDAKPAPQWLGGLLSVASGFTSFVAHAGGPPINAYVIPLKLAPLVFTASMGAFFLCINLSKWLPYWYLGLLDGTNLWTSAALLPIAPIGVWAGVKFAKWVKPELFYKLVTLGMLLTGLKLVWDGFVA
jgi:uncharacterized protein